MGSRRFPGKSMALLKGRPILWYLFRQVAACRLLEKRILATTDLAEDDGLAAFADGEGWQVFRGHPTDVLARYHDAATAFGAAAETNIVRLTGDDIWPDPGLVDAVVGTLESLAGHIDCVCTDRGDRLPYGAAVEAWPFRVLARAHADATDPYDREHVSPYIHKDPSRFPRLELVPSVPLKGISLSIDTPDDLARNDRLLDRLQATAEPPYRLHHILAASAEMGATP